MIKPNFLIAGAARSGSTSIYSYLKQHPEIYFCAIKEPNFFNIYFEMGQDWYLNLFYTQKKRALFGKLISIHKIPEKVNHYTNKKAIGEASVHYLNFPIAVKRIYDFNPEFKLIFILRNPIIRAFSAYKRYIQIKGEIDSFEKIIKGKYNQMKKYCLESGKYYTHINRFLNYFSMDQIHIIIFEDFISNPKKELLKICEFLGVNSELKFSRGIINKNPSKMPFSLLFQKITYKFFTPHLSESYLRIIFKSIFSKAFNYMNHIFSWRKFPNLTVSERQYLREYYSNEIINLEKLLFKDLSSWK